MSPRPAKMLRRAALFALALVFCSLGSPALAQRDQPAPGYSGEYIDEFKVRFDIRPNGALEVQETIKVYVKGKDIKRGIYRSFPNNRRESYQTDYYPISNLRVLRDGVPENIGKTEIDYQYYRTYFGQSDVKLKTNRFYTWQLNYVVPKAILQFDESDNFDWNVIGTEWEFPIRDWEVVVRYPQNAVILEEKVFTGSEGTTTAVHLSDKQQMAQQTVLRGQGLSAREGVTYVMRFTPELISPQEDYPVINQDYYDALERQAQLDQEREAERRAQDAAIRQELLDYARSQLPTALITLTVFLALSGIAFVVWTQVGKQRGVMPVVMPQFHPPNMVGPAASRYLSLIHI